MLIRASCLVEGLVMVGRRAVGLWSCRIGRCMRLGLRWPICGGRDGMERGRVGFCHERVWFLYRQMGCACCVCFDWLAVRLGFGVLRRWICNVGTWMCVFGRFGRFWILPIRISSKNLDG